MDFDFDCGRRVGLRKSILCGKTRKGQCGWRIVGITRAMILLHRPDLPIASGTRFFYGICCRELFESDHISNNVLEAIVQKVSVLTLDAWSQLSESEQDVSFFCESFFSTKTSYLRPLFGTLHINGCLISIRRIFEEQDETNPAVFLFFSEANRIFGISRVE